MELVFSFGGWLTILTGCGVFCLFRILQLNKARPQRLNKHHYIHLIYSGLIAFPAMCVAAYIVRNDSHIWYGLYSLIIIAISCFAIVTSEWITKYKKFSSSEFKLMVLFGEALFFACIFATAYLTSRIL